MENVLRTPLTRVIHTISLEMFLVVLLTPIISGFTGMSATVTGGLVLVFSILAIILNYSFNLLFDLLLRRIKKPIYKRGFGLRILNALFLEMIILPFSIPAIQFALDFTLEEALMLSIAIATSVMVISFTFNLFFDWCFEDQVKTDF